jgi:hypothetical protein
MRWDRGEAGVAQTTRFPSTCIGRSCDRHGSGATKMTVLGTNGTRVPDATSREAGTAGFRRTGNDLDAPRKQRILATAPVLGSSSQGDITPEFSGRPLTPRSVHFIVHGPPATRCYTHGLDIQTGGVDVKCHDALPQQALARTANVWTMTPLLDSGTFPTR